MFIKLKVLIKTTTCSINVLTKHKTPYKLKLSCKLKLVGDENKQNNFDKYELHYTVFI